MPRRLSLLLFALAAPAWSITGTTTTLKITSNGNIVGGISTPTTVVLTATVSASGTAVTPGQVKFCDNSINPHCTGNAYLGLAQLTSTGKATLPLRFGYGTHSLQAIFLGTKTYSGSQSTATGFVQRWKPGVEVGQILSSAGTISGSYDLSVAFTGLKASSSPPAPSGTVSFLDASNGNAVVGNVSLSPVTNASLNFTSVFQPATGPNCTGHDVPPRANCTGVAVGDFNGDGIPDLAIANSATSTITILLGSASGVFQTKTTLTVPTGAGDPILSIAVADLNSDGKLDLVVGDRLTNLVSFLGNGDGTFGAAIVSSEILLGPLVIGTPDLNGDGIPDLVIVFEDEAGGDNPAGFGFFFGNGDGTFSNASTIALNSIPASFGVTVGDLNGDGIPDIVVSGIYSPPASENFYPAIWVSLGKSGGGFQNPVITQLSSTAYATASGVQWMTPPPLMADFNNDGKLDVAVILPYDANPNVATLGTIAVALGNNDGTFQSPVLYAAKTRPSYLAATDLNSDGNQDLIWTNQVYHGTISLMLGVGDGTFGSSVAPFGVYANPTSVIAQDLIGNGKPDLVVLDPPSNRISVLLNNWGTISFADINNLTIPGTGTHNIKAYFPGDANYRQATSATIPLAASGP